MKIECSPTERRELLEMRAALMHREIFSTAEAIEELRLIPMGVAENLLSLDARTIKARMPWVEVAPNRSAVKLSDLKAFISSRTRLPVKRERSAA